MVRQRNYMDVLLKSPEEEEAHRYYPILPLFRLRKPKASGERVSWSVDVNSNYQIHAIALLLYKLGNYSLS